MKTKHDKVKRIFSNESETSNNEFDELNIKTESTFYSQNESRSDNENEYFENESNASSTESSKTYFTPKSKAQKERHPNNRRLVRLKSPQLLQQEYNRSCSRKWCSDYQKIHSQNQSGQYRQKPY